MRRLLLRSGLTRALIPAGRPAPNALRSVGLIRIAGTRVAWVLSRLSTVGGDDGPRATIHQRQLYKDPRLYAWTGGQRRELDAGAIDRRSLRLAHDAVHWTRDGEARSAALDPAC